MFIRDSTRIGGATLALLPNFMYPFWLHLILANNGGKGKNMPKKKAKGLPLLLIFRLFLFLWVLRESKGRRKEAYFSSPSIPLTCIF